MADIRQSFPTLEDDGTQAGEALISRIEGEAAASKEGSIGFSFKDSSGNVVLPQLTASGNVPTEEGGGGTCIDGTAKVAGSTSNTDVVTLTLALTKTYSSLEFDASSYRDTQWEIVHIDDVGGTPTETVIHQFVTGSGQLGARMKFDCAQFSTTGGTGTQNLVLRGQNRAVASDFRGYLGIKEA